MDPDSSLLILFSVLFISLFSSAFITAYETALSYLSSVRLQKRADEGDKKSQYLLKILHEPHQTLLTLMVCDWLADITFVATLTITLLHFSQNPLFLSAFILLITPILLIVGEVLPKSIATKQETRFVYTWLPVVRALLFGFRVPVTVLDMATRPFLDVVGSRFGRIVSDFTEEEIQRVVNLSANTGMLEEDETQLVRSALAFDDKPVSDVLTPRVDVVAVENTTTVDETLDIMAGDEGEGYSRLPVYKENLDQILGIVHIKDLVKIKRMYPEKSGLPVGDFVRKAHHITEYQSMNLVLKEMQALRMPFFIVTDEYGGTLGLVTMEDLLEEIVGDIRDEYDVDERPPLLEIDNQTIQVDARMSVSEVNEALDIALPNGQSVGGLVFNTLGEVPKAGESIRIDNAMLTVDEIDGIRIIRVRVHKLQSSEEALELAS